VTTRRPLISVICCTHNDEEYVDRSVPRAFYFVSTNPVGTSFFIEMKENPSPEPMIEAMKTNNATVAYFIVEEPRLGTEEYNRIVTQAQQNGLQTYQIFYYKGEEKLRIFYHKKSTD